MSEVLDAIREALGAYLAAELAAPFPTLVVHPDWPTAGQDLGEYALTVLATGELDHVFYPPTVMRSTPDTTGPNGLVTYSYGRVDGIQLELDAWACAKPKRDRLAQALEAALHRPPTATMPGAARERKLARRGGLVLPVPTLFDTPCHFSFVPVPAVAESSEAAETNEWRSHWRGHAELSLVNQEAVALIKRLFLQLDIDDGRTEIRRA